MPINIFKPKELISQQLLSCLLFELSASEDGKLPPASFFAEKFGVSIVTIREILKSMESTGIITMHHGRRIYLNHGETILLEMLETRILIESWCARLAALHAGDPGTAGLSELVGMLEDAIATEDMELYTDGDFLFHMGIAGMSGNLVLETTLRNIGVFLYVQQKETNRTLLDSREESLTEHRDILKAILDKNPDEAEKAMKRHLEKTLALWREH